MNVKLREKLIGEAKKRLSADDPSHDFAHTKRVLENALNIQRKEGGDLDVIIPAALFHDLVTYPKNDTRNKYSVDESAKGAREILENIPDYPKEKISQVEKTILCTSFSKGLNPAFLEAKIVRDADMLDATGAIAIMRTFTSSGKMGRPLYHPDDPFGKKRDLDSLAYSIDVFYSFLLPIKDRLITKTAKSVAEKRTKFLHSFLKELKEELAVVP